MEKRTRARRTDRKRSSWSTRENKSRFCWEASGRFCFSLFSSSPQARPRCREYFSVSCAVSIIIKRPFTNIYKPSLKGPTRYTQGIPYTGPDTLKSCLTRFPLYTPLHIHPVRVRHQNLPYHAIPPRTNPNPLLKCARKFKRSETPTRCSAHLSTSATPPRRLRLFSSPAFP